MTPHSARVRIFKPLGLLTGLTLLACSSSSDSTATPPAGAGASSTVGGAGASGASAGPGVGGGNTSGSTSGGGASSTAGQAGGAIGGTGSGISGASGASNATGGSTGEVGGSAGSTTAGGSMNGGAGNAGGAAGGSSGASGASQACPSPALQVGNPTRSITVGANQRSYVLHIPASYAGTRAAPLIIDFHGLGGSGPNEQTSSPYPAVTDADGVVMAFPTGLAGPSGNAWNVGPCCVDGTDDVAFAKALVADVERVACIDPKRVYAVGFSMGGGMSHYLACHAADVFAAVAPAAFDLLQENVTGCTPSRPITVVSFRSTADPIVPYAGGASSLVPNHPVTFLGAAGTFKKWSQLDGCSGAAADIGGGCQAYAQCSAGVEVELCTKQGGGHEPGNAQVAWPVLERHTLP